MVAPESPAAARHRQFRLRGREVLRVEAFSDAVFRARWRPGSRGEGG